MSSAGDKEPSAQWPDLGVVRVHFDPAALPRLGDEPGTNRFDDPRPRTVDRFLMRYAATTLRGCLLELLATFRRNPEAERRLAQIDTDDPEMVPAPAAPDWQPVADFLEHRSVANLTHPGPVVTSIHDPAVQRRLDLEPAVRAILDGEPARAALLERGGAQVHLDNAAVRLASATGRYITQACALALYDGDPNLDAIHYRSRHDDAEDCWAIYHRALVHVGPPKPLSPHVAEHHSAVNDVARLWDLPIPPAWRA